MRRISLRLIAKSVPDPCILERTVPGTRSERANRLDRRNNSAGGRDTYYPPTSGQPAVRPIVSNILIRNSLLSSPRPGSNVGPPCLQCVRRQNRADGFAVYQGAMSPGWDTFGRCDVTLCCLLTRPTDHARYLAGSTPALTSFRGVCKADGFPTMGQKCSLCRRRRGRRACPALGESICASCCGTKRLVEISCPADCPYLRSSQSHPPAAVQRQRERDLRFLIPLLEGMTERQHELTLLLQGLLRNDRPDAPAMLDDDVANAARALAETYETASRGIIYEHSAGTPSAERLSAEFRTLIESR